MKLSVVVVSYNECEYIDQAIQSCLNQKCDFEYEIIIGDDGSTDGSIEKIKKYVELYPNKISCFIMDRTNINNVIPSIRVSNILRKAFSIAKGKYVICLSGDDYYIGNIFQMQVDILEKNINYSSCYTNFKKVWNNGEQIELSISKINNRAVFWSRYYVHISCFMFRRDVFNNMPERFIDDVGLIFAILKTGNIYHIKEQGFAYRQRDKSIMHEADNMELCILELLLFQDVLNVGGYKTSSLSRFSKPLRYCYKNREKLREKKYEKYVNNSSKYRNDIIGQLIIYDKLSVSKKIVLRWMIFISRIWAWNYKNLAKIMKLF